MCLEEDVEERIDQLPELQSAHLHHETVSETPIKGVE